MVVACDECANGKGLLKVYGNVGSLELLGEIQGAHSPVLQTDVLQSTRIWYLTQNGTVKAALVYWLDNKLQMI